MAFWLVNQEYRATGWPNRTNITMRATDGEGGANFNGRITLAMCKAADHNTVVNLEVPVGTRIDANFVDGEWKLENADLKWYADNGYDTLVVNYGVRPIYRLFRTGRRDDNTRADNRGSDREGGRISLRYTTPKTQPVRDGSKKLTGYHIPFVVTAYRGKAPAADIRVDFYLDGEKQNDTPRTTVTDGSARFVFSGVPPSEDGYAQISARIVGTDTETVFDVPIPMETPEERKPTHMKPYVISSQKINEDKTMRHILRVQVTDQKHKGVGDIAISWNCGSSQGTATTANDAAQLGWTPDIVVELGEEASAKFLAIAPSCSLTDDDTELKGPPKRPDVVRLKSSATSPLNASGYKAIIPLEAFNYQGKGTAATLKVKVTQGSAVTFSNADDSSVQAPGLTSWEFTTGPDGKFRLGINFSGQLDIEVEVSYPDGKASLKFKVQYD